MVDPGGIQSWLGDTIEDMDDWDWDGRELTIFLEGEAVPRFLDQPYHILKVISYADTRYHQGIIYRAANFRESGRTISQKRHKNSRGPGMGKSELICFIYDLKKPNWDYEPLQPRLFRE